MKPERIRDLSIAATLFAANLLILGPWLLLDYSDQPWNNGTMYMAIARMFRERKWTWNSLEYAGAPFHYLSPPIFHVLVGLMPAGSIGLAFHLVAGIGYALVPAALYILGRQLFRSRLPAVFAAIVYSIFPVSLAPYFHAPWGFVTLVGQEEAAHTFALVFALLAIAAAWSDRWTIATLLAAAVLLTDWQATAGLALILVAFALVKSPAATIAMGGTAYGLSAFWITPGYLVSATLLNRVVLRHTLPGAPFNGTTWLVLLGSAILLGVSFWRRVPARLAVPLAWVAITGAVVFCFTSFTGLKLEFDVGLVLAGVGSISLAPRRRQLAIIAVLMVAGGAPAYSFVTHAWKAEPHRAGLLTVRNGVAYQVADWLNHHADGSRIYAAGELDGALALWSDVPQVGGSGQDVSNFLPFAAARQIGYGCENDAERISALWLRALNVRYLTVHGAASNEHYHWFARPERFAGLPVAWDNGAGDTIYQVPGFDAHDATIVDMEELRGMTHFRSIRDTRFLEEYVRWAAGKRPANIRWNGVDDARFDENLGPNEAILVKINNDPGWHALNAFTASDPIGFMLIEAPQGRSSIVLRFGPSWDTWIGRAITALTLLALVLLRGPCLPIAVGAVIPALAAYAALMVSAGGASSTVPIAEDAFVHLQPPLINPGGIVRKGDRVSVYGLNFGAPGDDVRVHVGDRLAEVLYHGPNMVDFRMPGDTPPVAAVSVEVNGCRGNGFTVAPK